MAQLYSVKIAGPAGFGIMEAGRILGRALNRAGFKVLVYPEYQSRIRGGDNVSQVVFSTDSQPLVAPKDDILVALSSLSLEKHQPKLKEDGLLLANESLETPNTFSFSSIAKDEVGREIARNVVALGLVWELLGLDRELLNKEIKNSFSDKGEKIIEGNQKAAEAGAAMTDQITEKPSFSLPTGQRSTNVLVSGNQAIARAALQAGCNYAAIYPMTPINDILTILAGRRGENDLIVLQPEDEIAGINSAVGAAFAGRRALVATSGGGFSLMVEGFGMAGATETPLVVVEGMRAGPSSGMATWTSQEDLLFLVHAGNGEFPRIIVTPGNPRQAYELTIKAFNWAEIYQLPVVVVTDKYLSESDFSTPSLSGLKADEIDRGKLLSEDPSEDYKRYRLTKDGVSPRALPGQAQFLTNSYVHDEMGFSVEDGEIREQMKEKLFRKLTDFSEAGFEIFGDKDAPTKIVSWGSTRAAVDRAQQNLGEKVAVIHFYRPWPLSQAAKKVLKEAEYLVAVENNTTGQLARLIQQETAIKIDRKVLKDNGRPFLAGEIESSLRA